MRLSKLKEITRPLSFDFLGETINVTYRPAAYTPALEEESQRMLQETTDGASLSRMLATLLEPIMESWDVLDDQDQPIPCTLEGLREVPFQLQSAVIQAVAADTNPQAPKSKRSGSFNKG
jgi:hypothetical protein